MNCDEAFDRMTSPGAPDDSALRHHLNGCRRCRDMQETLSPAIEWLTVADEPSAQAERARFLTEDAVQVAERAAHRLGTRSAASAPRRVDWRKPRSWWIAAGMGAAFLLAVALPSSHQPARPAPLRSLASPTSDCLWTLAANDLRRTQPVAEQLIAACAACHLASR